jgi:hypothetical protein
MHVLLLQLDGRLPNIALMRLTHHYRAQGAAVTLRRVGNQKFVQPDLYEPTWDYVYGSLIFERSRLLAEHLRQNVYPGIILGGTGWDVTSRLEQYGITTITQDYSPYARFRQSMGFTQRGCRLRCGFCVVPRSEGPTREEQSIWDIWRGDPWPREILLLDNDFFGQPHWQARIEELQRGRFKVSFNQGINARMLTDETAAAMASVDYRDDSMKYKRLYTAFDNAKDAQRLFAGLSLLEKHGVKPANIMVYMLIGYFNDDDEEWDQRRAQLRAFGCTPYPMPFVRTPKTIGFQRYCQGAYDKRVSWQVWQAAGYDPHKVGLDAYVTTEPLF